MRDLIVGLNARGLFNALVQKGRNTMPLRNLTITTMFLLPMQDFKGPSFPKSSCVSDVKAVFSKIL